jgi:hypothetical protein
LYRVQLLSANLSARRRLYAGNRHLEVRTDDGDSVWSREWSGAKVMQTVDGQAGELFLYMRKESSDFDVLLQSSTPGFYLVSLGSSGALEWINEIDSRASQSLVPTALAATGNRGVVFGGFNGIQGIRVGGTTLNPESGQREACFIKIDSSGRLEWALHSVSTGEPPYVTSVASDSHGNTYWAGFLDAKARVGEIEVLPEPAGTRTAFILMLDRSGRARWGRPISLQYPSIYQPSPLIFCASNGEKILLVLNELSPSGRVASLLGFAHSPPQSKPFFAPKLNLTNRGDDLVLSWDFTAGNCVIETTSDLASPFIPQPETATARLSDGIFEAKIDLRSRRNAFFRLRQTE